MQVDQPVVVVLAAGQGARFGGSGHKLAQPFGARTVLGQTLANVVRSGLPLVVVTTAALAAEASQVVAQRDIITVTAADQQRGVGGSVALGVSARAAAAGWLLLPADMPLVSPDSLRAVAQALPGHALVVPQHGGLSGHPVGFSAELFGELLVLAGDEGLRRLLRRFPVHGLELPDAGIRVGIDTRSDLEAARELSTRGAMAGTEPLG